MVRLTKRRLAWSLLIVSGVILALSAGPLLRILRIHRGVRQLGAEDQTVQALARERLVSLGRPAIPILLREMGRNDCPIRSELASLVREMDGDFAVEHLAAGLDSADIEERTVAAQHLGVLEEPAAGPLLLPLLEDSSVQVFRAAVISLSFLGCQEALPRLRKLLVEGGAGRRAWSAYGLGFLEDQESIPLLERAVRRDGDPAVRYQARTALQRMDALPADLAAENSPGEDGL